MTNHLYYGDNLQVLREHIKDESVDLVYLDPPKPMLTEAIKAGFYETPHGKFPKLQILTIDELFKGKKPLLPWIDPSTFKKAVVEDQSKQHTLF